MPYVLIFPLQSATYQTGRLKFDATLSKCYYNSYSQTNRNKYEKVGNKVVVVGLGAVGVSYAYSMLNQALCDDMVLIDINRTRTEGEARDFRHGMPYAASPARIYVGDYDDCSDADIVCICAGAAQAPGETRLDLIDKNLRIFHDIVSKSWLPALMASSWLPQSCGRTVLCRSALSGLSKERVIGSGTILDSPVSAFVWATSSTSRLGASTP